ncbi:hypothetical protein A2630_00795 [Candidatus Woesebacteria bacterium RIFCSPHIGHO2_01_FULL_44_10]|uniref:Uncharacterized protein n=1 Tax=Candidatus Woesebacteria bacterium RIFCSPLOWO2_01_FULL_44_14 TaxID=1802525 RepID=A0A1F8C1V5_9BACT|nr:MAG: hypothetical protein A2630_00795 [Candidatus Woesebacteria bacterium RIFCSPHIGHO2_01_FULL_44_10]OGM54341.1 MAG: hypothetical protein A3F62_01130 [Candidatus Woesebacteria bacterium RIFCSPHIGHO2_12_FULL_44_11]OGM70242.1 MAG: hypothetical protein A2975_04180 [Candidatus Woesebacteria bacterium RIFCSPLOWO2_01_FULL_44_14]
MTSLTQVAISTRKIIRYGIYGILGLIALRIIFGLGINLYKRLFPKPPPPPTVAFGKLPGLPFPEKERPQVTYTLQTVTGQLPALPTQTKVYFMPQLSSNLLALESAKQKATSLGFVSEPIAKSETIYTFPHPRVPSDLEMNIITGSFSISYNLSIDSSPVERRPSSPEIAASQVRSFLSSANLLPEDLTGQTSHEFLKIEALRLVDAISLSEADLVRVNLFRRAYDELPAVTPDPKRANVWFLVTGASQREKQIVNGEYHYFPVDEEQSSTYPIKTAQDAYNELAAGAGYIANMGQSESGQVVIREVYLAYYDAGEQVEFYQPVIVFAGDNNFIAYVPAVTADYYEE